MFQKIMEGLSKASGAIAGIFTGALIGPYFGYLHAYYGEHRDSNYVHLLFIACLPGSIILSAKKGFDKGLEKGLIAGINFPKTSYDFISWKIQLLQQLYKSDREVRLYFQRNGNTITNLMSKLLNAFEVTIKQDMEVATTASLKTSTINPTFFSNMEDRYIEENRHFDASLQHEYDKRHGLIICK